MKQALLLLAIVLWSFPVAAAKAEFKEIKGDNFIIYYRDDVPTDFAENVLETASEEFKTISRTLGLARYQNWRSDKRAKITIYSDEEDYMSNAGNYKWSHGIAMTGVRVIQTYPQEHGFFDTTLPHELGHIILREIIGERANAPIWFEEGVAMYQEKARRFGSDKKVLELIKNDQFIPLSELSNMRLYKDTDEKVVSQFYVQSASIVGYLISEFGAQKFHWFLKALSENLPFEQALSKTYLRFRSLDALNKAWVNYLKGN